MLHALDLTLTVLHTGVVVGSLTLWIPKRTRRWHLGLVTVVALSWLVAGPLLGRGLGYCAFTDLHWRLKRALGEHHLPSSFITYLFDLVGVDARSWAHTVTAVTFGVVCSGSLALEVQSWFRRNE